MNEHYCMIRKHEDRGLIILEVRFGDTCKDILKVGRSVHKLASLYVAARFTYDHKLEKANPLSINAGEYNIGNFVKLRMSSRRLEFCIFKKRIVKKHRRAEMKSLLFKSLMTVIATQKIKLLSKEEYYKTTRTRMG